MYWFIEISQQMYWLEEEEKSQNPIETEIQMRTADLILRDRKAVQMFDKILCLCVNGCLV